MRKLNSIDWEGAYQAYCSSGLGIRTFIAQEMHQYCYGVKLPCKSSVSRYFSKIKQPLQNANRDACAEIVGVHHFDDQQWQTIVESVQNPPRTESDQDHVVKVFVSGVSISVTVRHPHIFIANLIKQVKR